MSKYIYNYNNDIITMFVNKYNEQYDEITLSYNECALFFGLILSNTLLIQLSYSEFISKKISITNNVVYIIYGFIDNDGIYDEEIKTMSINESKTFIEWLKFHILPIDVQRKLKMINLRNN